jgi:hypothetical protein
MNKSMLELGTAIIWAATMIAYTVVEDTTITGNLVLVFGGGFLANIIFIKWYISKNKKQRD